MKIEKVGEQSFILLIVSSHVLLKEVNYLRPSLNYDSKGI